MHFYRSLFAAAATLALAGLASAEPAVPGRLTGPVQVVPTATALSQIRALIQEKAQRTPAQRRIDTNLRFAAQMQRGVDIVPGVHTLRSLVRMDQTGRAEVDVEGEVTPALLQSIQAAGGQVENSFPQYHTLRAHVSLGSLEKLAAMPGVRFIKTAQQGHVISYRPFPAGPLTPMRDGAIARRQAVEAALPDLLRQAAFETPEGASPTPSPNLQVDKEGYYAHRVNLAFHTFFATGKGIKVGVLSNSVDYLPDAQKAGALGPVTILPGQGDTGKGESGEGTALLEVIHRVAPDAALYFATANGSEASFANNIEALRAAGCNIIVDDVQYFDESPFQDGPIAQAVDAVVASGALYFSSAGNDYNLDAAAFGPGTSATWEGDWKDSGKTFTYEGGSEPVLAFDAKGTTEAHIAAVPGLFEVANLFWANPLGGATDEYDLFIVDKHGTLVAASTNSSDGTQDPYQVAIITPGDNALIGQYPGSRGVFLHLDVGNDGAGLFTNTGTTGSTRGHDCAEGAYDVAAVDASIAYQRSPPTFTAKDVVETFSSDGPRRVFFDPSGNEYTPGNLSSTGGQVRRKPTLAAADGVTIVAVPGFAPFYGTSAAAPHAAAIAALALSNNPALRPSGIFNSFANATNFPLSTIDIMAPGYDVDSGYGILDAYNLLLLTTPHPKVSSVSPQSGPVGTIVTITGTNLETVAGVIFHGVPAPFEILSHTKLLAQVPPGATSGPLELIPTQFSSTLVLALPDFIVTPTVKK